MNYVVEDHQCSPDPGEGYAREVLLHAGFAAPNHKSWHEGEHG